MPQTTDRTALPLTPDTLESRLRDTLAPGLLLVREIGAGGMARVFLAREPALKRLVAVKVLSGDLASNPESRARFEREAQAVAQLSHPNIVAIHTVGELADKTPYFVMQYVEGRSMAERVKAEGTLSVSETRRIIGEVAAALAVAHAQGIIHRDVKPANILYEDSTGRSLVSDFGIAAMSVGAAPLPANMRLTGTGMIVGTPQYMSPEQLLAEPVSEKTDVYSLGLLAHELLIGTGPFKASSPHELIAAHLRDTPARLSGLRPDVDPELDEIVARCLQKDSARRPPAGEVAQRLAPGGAALLEWPPPGLDDLVGRMRWLARPWVLGGLLIQLTALVSFLVGTRMASIAASPATVLLLLGALIGVGLLIEAVRRVVLVSRRVGRALAAGYGWMTLAEVLCDTRGDTGNIITGSREYAPLTMRQRERWRALRVVRELILLASGLVSLLLLVLYVAIASASGAGESVSWFAPVLSLLLVLLAGNITLRERHVFDRRRAQKTRREADTARLAEPWNESFERAREGQRIGRGLRDRRRLARIALGALAGLALLLALAMLPLVAIATLGPVMLDAPNYARARARVQEALKERPLALPKDSSITPLAAGRAFHQIIRSYGDAPLAAFPEHPIPALPRAVWRDTLPPGLFAGAREATQFPGVPDHRQIFAVTRRGVSAAELAHLERIGRDSVWRAWSTLARAPHYDLRAARYPLPWPDAIRGWWGFPIPRYVATREFAQASVTRAAWHLARGRRDSAEAVLRETISVGMTLAQSGISWSEQTLGVTIVNLGRESLQRMWDVLGDPRARELRLRIDASNATVDAVNETARSSPSGLSRSDVSAMRRAMVRFVVDSTAPRGLRIEMLQWLAITPCTNLRELVFGYAPDVESAFAAARRTIARSASDSAIIQLIEETPERLNRYNEDGRRPPALPFLRIAGGMLMNPRFSGCTGIVLANVTR